MALFIVGVLFGAFAVIIIMAMISASEMDDEQRADLCRGCPYEDYSGGRHDCLYCHEVDDGK